MSEEREEREMDGGREKQFVCVFDEPGSQADCTSKHVSPCYHPAHFLEWSEQAIRWDKRNNES